MGRRGAREERGMVVEGKVGGGWEGIEKQLIKNW